MFRQNEGKFPRELVGTDPALRGRSLGRAWVDRGWRAPPTRRLRSEAWWLQ
jgi:hypothetical protein